MLRRSDEKGSEGKSHYEGAGVRGSSSLIRRSSMEKGSSGPLGGRGLQREKKEAKWD